MPNFFFQRYVHGERMADDVLITKQPTLEAAIPEALRLCRNSPKSVLVYVPEDNVLSEEITRLREELAAVTERMSKLDFERTAAELERDALREENARLRSLLAAKMRPPFDDDLAGKPYAAKDRQPEPGGLGRIGQVEGGGEDGGA